MRPRPAFFLLVVAVTVSRALLAQSGGHIISGFVREESSNSPLATVALQLLSSGRQARPSVTSGADGEFSFTGLPDGEFSIVATKTGYDSITIGVTIMRSGTQPVMILLHRSSASKLLGVGSSVSAHELAIPERARVAFEKGSKLLEDENRPAESIPEFQRAVDAFSQYYEAYTKLGIANYELSKFPESEAALKKSIEVSSGKFLEPLYLLADLYNGQRKYQDAEPLARQAVALDESSWNGHFELARALVGLKKGTEAETSALRARELKPNSAPVHLVLANAHLLEQNYKAAIQDFDAYLNLEPSGPLSESVRQRRANLQQQLQQTPITRQATPPPATPQQP